MFLEIIDFARKGNVVRFYLGKNGEQYGDDWDDTPYEHNAGLVYDEFIKGYVDIKFSFDYLVLEPCSGAFNSNYCKNDMVQRKVPCILAIAPEVYKNDNSCWYDYNFTYWLGNDNPGIVKYYFGHELEPDVICNPNEEHISKEAIIEQMNCYINNHDNTESKIMRDALRYIKK